MGQISVYLNPKASAANHQFEMKEIRKFFFRHELNFQTPTSIEELIERVKADRSSEVDCIFSIGGDGTAHTIAQHLIGSKTKLFVLPGGTANDLASELGTNSSLKKIAHIFNARTTKKVDIIQVNNRYLITNGGIGVAQEVVHDVNHQRKSSVLFNAFLKSAGKNAYSALLLSTLLTKSFKLHDVYVDSSDYPFLKKMIRTPLILINNQPKLAGKFPVAPETKNDDGSFNVTIFLHKNRFEFMKCALEFLQGKYPIGDTNLISFETSNLKLISTGKRPLHFFGDGENFEPSMELAISIIPRGLEVFTHSDDTILCHGHSLDKIPTIQ